MFRLGELHSIMLQPFAEEQNRGTYYINDTFMVKLYERGEYGNK
jgi:hypothetical protein